MIIVQQTFILLLQRVILHLAILYETLLHTSKSEHANSIIWIRIVWLTLQSYVIKMKLYYIVENMTHTFHAKMNPSSILTSCRHLSFLMATYTWKKKFKGHWVFIQVLLINKFTNILKENSLLGHRNSYYIGRKDYFQPEVHLIEDFHHKWWEIPRKHFRDIEKSNIILLGNNNFLLINLVFTPDFEYLLKNVLNVRCVESIR